MAKIIWTNRALNDLESIGDYIATDSEKYAKLTISKLVNNALRIENKLNIGRLVPELNDENIRGITV